MTTETTAPAPWDDVTASQLSRMAARSFQHEHGGPIPRDKEGANLVRANCEACNLEGYRDIYADAHDHDGPNDAGWARVYTQARRPVPRKWANAFARERADINRPYADALERDIVTFGNPLPPSAQRHAWVKNGCRCHVVCMNCGQTSRDDERANARKCGTPREASK